MTFPIEEVFAATRIRPGAAYDRGIDQLITERIRAVDHDIAARDSD